ncbi:MAG: S8 family peptidase [Bacteroidota bacterium]
MAKSKKQNEDFDAKKLDRTLIAMPLLEMIDKHKEKYNKKKKKKKKKKATFNLDHIAYDVIIDLHLFFPSGRKEAKELVIEAIDKIVENIVPNTPKPIPGLGVKRIKTKWVQQYVFAKLTKAQLYELVNQNTKIKASQSTLDTTADEEDTEDERLAPPPKQLPPEAPEIDTDITQKAEAYSAPPIYKIWPDFKLKAHVNKSRSTVKADAAHISFNAKGKYIVWAVMDSGIDGNHEHFKTHHNLDLPEQLSHWDFTKEDPEEIATPEDDNGHGTHVAGIIAGEMKASPEKPIWTKNRKRDKSGGVVESIYKSTKKLMSGMAPHCTLLSLKVLDAEGRGETSNLIAAMGYIQQMNNHGRYLHIHGVNMSVGYNFNPEWFACGQSPLCVEVNRLVRSGVVVVVAAGNTGYGYLESREKGVVSAGMALTINDPGNAELAITVGATHRDMPHVYGVSFFSSKGPTGDGRLKPDLVAPGEKIISCARVGDAQPGSKDFHHYKESSGTSMAAPHVSGVIAAFLSVRREFINNPIRVKEIFTSTATDLNRERYFQGHGLVDLMRAIQSV